MLGHVGNRGLRGYRGVGGSQKYERPGVSPLVFMSGSMNWAGLSRTVAERRGGLAVAVDWSSLQRERPGIRRDLGKLLGQGLDDGGELGFKCFSEKDKFRAVRGYGVSPRQCSYRIGLDFSVRNPG